MAKNTEDNEIELDASVKKGGKGKLILIITLIVLLLSGATVGTLYFTGVIGAKGKPEKADEKEKVAEQGPAIYYALTPEFIVNFEGNQQANYLQVEIQLMTRHPEVIEILKHENPMIRNNVLLLLSGQKYDELRTLAGKEKLRAEVLKAIQKVVKTESGKPGVEAVYFTSFIMQ